MKNNYFLALICYTSLRRSLERYPDKFKVYNDAIEAMIENKETEEVTENPNISKSMSPCLYYIPHSGVYKKDRVTASLRIVFDTSY